MSLPSYYAEDFFFFFKQGGTQDNWIAKYQKDQDSIERTQDNEAAPQSQSCQH